jgi:hypothetical protein
MEVFTLPFDGDIVSPTNQSYLLKCRAAWQTFQRIGLYNYNVRQTRLGNPKALVSYYRYTLDEERQEYNLGLQLYLKQYPEFAGNLDAIIPVQI